MSLRRDQSAVVDREVRGLLAQSHAFHALPPHERDNLIARTAQIAQRMVAHELAGGISAPAHPAHRHALDDPYALALSDPGTDPVPAGPNGVTTATAGTPPAKWRPDERFQAEGVSAGVTQVGRMIKEVDFPAFVASLVKGTFQAVVDASIQQMKAYGDLVQSVAQSLNDFADENVADADSQKKLVSKYPNVFEFGEKSDLKVKDDFDEDSMPNFMADLGLDAPVTDLEDPDSLQKLVTGAKLELARGRQQLLATTILMGINRIIITDGRINAKIKFDFSATDHQRRSGSAEDSDTRMQVLDFEQGIGQRYVKGHFEKPISVSVSSTASTSEAAIDASAKLSGEVSLNFRSETFPLEKMMTSGQLFQLNQVQSGARGVPPASTTTGTPPAPTPATTTGP